MVPFEGSDEDNKALNAFASGGLNTNKNLKSYDCWDEDKTPQEWLAECKHRNPPHAKCPMYNLDKKYVWSSVEILDWDAVNEKFKVRVMDSDVIKLVGRLSVMFVWEDQVLFQ